MQHRSYFKIPDQFNLNQLKIPYKIHPTRKIKDIRTYYDTFDGRLLTSGMQLFKFNREIILLNKENQVRGKLSTGEVPVFAKDFPLGNLRDNLEKIIEVRALLDLVKIPCVQQTILFFNENDKVILKLILEKFTYNDHLSEFFATVSGIKGYSKPVQFLKKRLISNKYAETCYPTLQKILHQTGCPENIYKGKLNFNFNPQMPVKKIVKEILKILTEQMEANELGVVQDIDTEFLHDYRVAVRRIRSAIVIFESILPLDLVNWAKEAFSNINRITNQLRDLDVFLHKEQFYQSQIQVEYHTYLKNFFRHQRKHRLNEYKKVSDYLNSDEYKTVKKNWIGRVSCIQPLSPFDSLSEDKGKWIENYLKRVKKISTRITIKSSDEDLHKLRIACKKLRYVMEFLESLCPSTVVKTMLKELKRLQDQLGRYHDIEIQQKQLQEFSKTVDRETQAVIIDLIRLIGVRKRKERVCCLRYIQRFRSKRDPRFGERKV